MPLRGNALGKEMQRQFFQGIGKPEPLRQALAGCRSRRGNDEHSLVSKVTEEALLRAQLRCHGSP